MVICDKDNWSLTVSDIINATTDANAVMTDFCGTVQLFLLLVLLLQFISVN